MAETTKKSARAWRDVRVDITASGRVDAQGVENAREEMVEEIRAMKLAEVRKGQHVSQTLLAKGMKVSQARVSKIESGELSKTELGTLQSYVEALGGRLKIVADFGDETIIVRD